MSAVTPDAAVLLIARTLIGLACLVREECLELALRNSAVGQHGVWGGTVPAEREKLRAGRAAQLARALARNRDADQAAS